MIKAIIFDCFGVLVGTGFNDTYHQAGGDPVQDKKFIHETLDASNIGDLTAVEFDKVMAEKIGIPIEQWRLAVNKAEQPNQPILDYIKTLKNTYKVAILSNVGKGTLPRKLSKEQLGLFDVVVESAALGMMKPDPAIYKYTADQLGVEPDECVFMDDIQAYVDGAVTGGMKAILYEDFVSMKPQLEKLLADSNN